MTQKNRIADDSKPPAPRDAAPRRAVLRRAVTRRAVIKRAALALAGTPALCDSMIAAEPVPRRTGMGLVIYDCNFQRKWLRASGKGPDLFDPFTFLKHCHSLGAGGMQVSLGDLSAEQIGQLKEYAGLHDLFIDAIVRPPEDAADVSRFEASIRTARDVGVQAARTTIMPGRRYERFKTLEEFKAFERRGRQMLERATPIVEKYHVPLAVENHKDQRLSERVALFEHLASEYVGACVDTGNSFALLDGAYEPIEALAPYAFTVHLKDQALQEYEDGFLLGDIPLGQGSFDLLRMVRALKSEKPNVRFVLELITRDALRVPCLTDSYYATLPDVRATDLSRTLRFVRDHTVKDLQSVSRLALPEQVDLERKNVLASLQYAGEVLHL